MKRIALMLRASAAGVLLACGTAFSATIPEDALASLQAAYLRAVAPGERADFHRDLLATVLQRVERNYATEFDGAALVAAAMKVLEPLPAGAGDPAEVFRRTINGGLSTLDNYSRYMDPQAHGAERTNVTGAFGGLGLEVEAGDGGVRVTAPIPDSPAARAGLLAGDVIVRVDDQPLQGVPLADAIARMRGQPGTAVAVTIRRAGVDDFTVSLTRDTIRRQMLRWSMEGDVLVLRLGTFTGPVASALENAIAQATAAHAPRAVVLDLRGNPGGLLREAVRIADSFLTQGDIVSLRGRTASNQRNWQADANELLPGLPMVVLIDGRSASASELVAAALQENGRATVMGQRSFGKGTVQSTLPLGADKGALKLTTAHYHAPTGRAVQKAGVSPDIEIVGALRADEAGGSMRVEQGRCSAVYKAADPALACAVGLLGAGDRDAFLHTVAPRQH